MLANGKQKIWVSNIIGNDYKLWKNEFVVLDCGTGCGKTYFSLHVLGNYAKKQKKKILYLCNRRKLRKQIYSDTKSLGLLNVVSFNPKELALLFILSTNLSTLPPT